MGSIQIVDDGQSLPSSVEGTVASIGVFDGVHRGHQKLLGLVTNEAKSKSIPSVVITFDQHPTQITSPENAPKILTPLGKKIQLLEELGIDYVYVLSFNKERASTPATQFIQEIFVDAVRAKSIYIGEDFQFGYKRSGNVELLESEGKSLDINVNGIKLFKSDSIDQGQVSSTVIRKHLELGEIELANEKLGRSYECTGIVVSGDKRGREIGFPTANININESIATPADGVYAAWYHFADGEKKPSAVNIGKRPTFSTGEEKSIIEAHILDFDGDLYGDEATLVFEKRIRPEVKFADLEALKHQLEKDLSEIRTSLS